jgi:hypothetical protein
MRTLGLLILASALVSTATGATVFYEDLSAPSESLPTGEPGWTAPDAAVLWNNGPLITCAGCCPAATHESQIRPGGTTFGYGGGQAANLRLADNFTVPAAEQWEIQSLTIFPYLTGANSAGASPVTGVNYQIWNGEPGAAGSVVVCGNTTTNVMALSTFSGIYRTTAAAPCPGTTNRPLWATISTLPQGCPPCLPAGTYWIDFQFVGGTFYPPVTPRLGGPDATPDSRQSQAGVWVAIADAGDLQTEDLPFILEGVVCNATPVENSTWGGIKGQYR